MPDVNHQSACLSALCVDESRKAHPDEQRRLEDLVLEECGDEILYRIADALYRIALRRGPLQVRAARAYYRLKESLSGTVPYQGQD